MLEILQFIFSSFWVWAGTVVLIAVFGVSVGGVLSAAVMRKGGA